MKKGFLLLPLASLAYSQDYQIHILQENETLSELLQQRGYSPLYGEKSWVEKTLAMNHLSAEDAKKIKKGPM